MKYDKILQKRIEQNDQGIINLIIDEFADKLTISDLLTALAGNTTVDSLSIKDAIFADKDIKKLKDIVSKNNVKELNLDGVSVELKLVKYFIDAILSGSIDRLAIKNIHSFRDELIITLAFGKETKIKYLELPFYKLKGWGDIEFISAFKGKHYDLEKLIFANVKVEFGEQDKINVLTISDCQFGLSDKKNH